MTDMEGDVNEPTTEAGQWLLSHQGLINIGKIDGSMRGDEIDLRAAILAIESEARATAPAGLDVDRYGREICNLSYLCPHHRGKAADHD